MSIRAMLSARDNEIADLRQQLAAANEAREKAEQQSLIRADTLKRVSEYLGTPAAELQQRAETAEARVEALTEFITNLSCGICHRLYGYTGPVDCQSCNSARAALAAAAKEATHRAESE